MGAKKEHTYENYVFGDSSSASNAMKMYLKEIEEYNTLQKEIEFLEYVDNITMAGRMILTNGDQMMYADWTGEEYDTEASLPTYEQMEKEFFEAEEMAEGHDHHHHDGCGCSHDHHEEGHGCGCGDDCGCNNNDHDCGCSK